jgi:hypothetical protein
LTPLGSLVTYIYPDWLPTVDELGAFMSSRTMGGTLGFSEQGTFDTTTRPTAVQAQARIEDAADRVIPKVGEVTGIASRIAKQAVMTKAAALIELNYMPEQAALNSSTYSLYETEYTSLLKDAVDAAMEVDATGLDPDAGDGIGAIGAFDDPVFPVDPCDVTWMNRRW